MGAKGIFLTTDTSLVGGVVTYIKNTAILLHEEGFAVAVGLRTDAPSLAPIAQELLSRGIPVVKPTDTTFFQKGYIPLVTGFGPLSYKAFFSAFGKQVIVIVHDQVDIYYPGPLQSLYRVGYRTFQVPNLKKAWALITVSDWAREFLLYFYSVKHVFTIKNAVDTKRFQPVESEAVRVKHKKLLSVDTQKPLVLIPGRLSPEKNPFIALKVAKLLPKINFAFVGSGELEGFIRMMVSLMGLRNVLLLGKRYDMEKVYAAADVVFQPTLGENQSLTTLEAMSAGLPVVTTSIPAQREIISHLHTGILAPPEARSFAEWILFAIETGSEIGQRARQFIVENHDLGRYAFRFVSVLNQITQLSHS